MTILSSRLIAVLFDVIESWKSCFHIAFNLLSRSALLTWLTETVWFRLRLPHGPCTVHPSGVLIAIGSSRFPCFSSSVKNASGVSAPIRRLTGCSIVAIGMSLRWSMFLMSCFFALQDLAIGSFGIERTYSMATECEQSRGFTVMLADIDLYSVVSPVTVVNLRLEGRSLIPSLLKRSSVPSDDWAPPSNKATAIISLSPFEIRTGSVRK